MGVNKDYFNQMAKNKKKEQKEKEENKANWTSFDPYLWTAFAQVGESKILRFMSDMYVDKEEMYDEKDAEGNFIFDGTSARIVNVATIYGDNGRKFFAFVPDKEENSNYIYHRMMATVLQVEWVDSPKGEKDSNGEIKKVKKYIHQIRHPELVDRFLTNGHDHGISPNKFDKGWKFQRMLLANVIDREMIEKHKETKHTFFLSKNVNVMGDKTYYDYGVPEWGFTNQLLDAVSFYGGLTNYDMLVERVGEQNTPFKVRNASKYAMEVPEYLTDLVSSSPLTEEELSWEQYDIREKFQPTSYTKWYNKIKILAKEIDLKFGTYYYNELKEKAEQEKVNRKKDNDSSVETYSNENISTSEPAETPARRRGSNSTITWKTLASHGYVGEEFFVSVKNLIKGIEANGNIIWLPEAGDILGCTNDNCDCTTPESVETGCVKCGTRF